MADVERKAAPEYETETGDAATPTAAAGAKPSFFQRFKSHMKKWWWVYLIVLIVVVLVVVLPIVYVGVPRFASDYINNKYKYDYNGLEISDPTPTSFHVRQKLSLNVGGSFKGASGHFQGFDATVYSLLGEDAYTDVPMGFFPVPDITFGGKDSVLIDQTFNISCVECLSRLAAAAASDKESQVLATGESTLKVGALPDAHLKLHKKLPVQAYNVNEFLNTKGNFNVTGIQFSREKDEEGNNVNATVSVRNPSPFIVDMGTATFNLSVSDQSIGTVTVPSLSLNEDVSDIVVLGDIDVETLVHKGIGNDDPDAKLGDVTIDIKGDKVVYHGTEIVYFTSAIQAMQAPLKVNLLDYASDLL